MQSPCDEICGATAPREPCPARRVVGRGTSAQYLIRGGSVLVRRRIQTPSAAKVRSAVQREGEVVLGASPPARRIIFLSCCFWPAKARLAQVVGDGGGRLGLRRPHGLSPYGP